MLKATVVRLLTVIALIAPVAALIGGVIMPPGVSWT